MSIEAIKLYEKENGGFRCLLCPHFCVLKKLEAGKCKVRINMGDKVTLYTHGWLNAIAVEPISKKPFFHFLPLTKTLSIGGCGCNLSCQFCQNYEISQVTIGDNAEQFHPFQVVIMALNKECKSVCMTYNEPVVYYEYLLELAGWCRDEGLKFIIKTNAYINKEPWKQICKVVDAMNIDWKGTEREYKEFCGASEYVVEDRIKEAYDSGVHIELSVPIYPGNKFGLYNKQMADFVASIDDTIPVHLLRIYADYKWEKLMSTTKSEVNMAEGYFSSKLKHVYI